MLYRLSYMGSPSYTKSHHTYYIVIDYIPYTVHFLSMNNLFCNWKFVPLNLPHLFHFSPPPLELIYNWNVLPFDQLYPFPTSPLHSASVLCCVLCLVDQSCLTLCDRMDYSLPGSSVHVDSPGQNTGAGSRSLLQGIFPTQGSNPGLPHCRQILYHLSHREAPRMYLFYISL